jgi:hypothetical protein
MFFYSIYPCAGVAGMLLNNLFSTWYSWKIAHLKININHALAWFLIEYICRKPPNHARIPNVKIERHYRWSWIFPVRRCHSYDLCSDDFNLGAIYPDRFTLTLFIEVTVPSQESDRSCICVLNVYILCLFLRIFCWVSRIPNVKIERHYRWSWIFPVRRCHSYDLISSLMTNKSNISMVL